MESKNQIKMGTIPDMWGDGKSKVIVFSVTEDCNLACKYCYLSGKNTKNKMTFEVAKQAVDYILSHREIFDNECVTWDFIGGEPFLEIELIDKISDYIKVQMYLLNHPWFDRYMLNFSTNGLLYNTPEVQRYIKKNRTHISVGFSVDGNKIKHDLQRVKLDGTGSYDDVVKNVPLWLSQFPTAVTKATFSHEDLVHLKDSIISLWNLGITTVSANVVFEDVWYDGDDVILENQLKDLADYIIEKKLWNDYSVRFFNPNIGFPLTEEELNRNSCGTGRMMAVNYEGKFFPCVRFIDYSLNNRKGYCIGDVRNGVNSDKLRPFIGLTLKSLSSKECIECEVASGCPWCSGYNYDCADTDTIYHRATYNCKMHKAQIRATEYFWNRYSEATGLESPRDEKWKDRLLSRNVMSKQKYLLIITSDNITPHCTYSNWKNTDKKMDEKLLRGALKFAKENNFLPVILSNAPLGISDTGDKNLITIGQSNSETSNNILIYNNQTGNKINKSGVCILHISKHNLSKVAQFVKELSAYNVRITIVLDDISDYVNSDIEEYERQLDLLVDLVVQLKGENRLFELNVLTDLISLKSMNSCGAGINTFALAPNGKLYLCPAFYFDNPDSCIGDIKEGFNAKEFKLHNSFICESCDAYQCRRCIYLNKKHTGEYNTPPKVQCILSNIERNKTRELQIKMQKTGIEQITSILPELDYLDPVERILKKRGR